MSSQITTKSNPTTTRSVSLNISPSTPTNRDHDLRYSLSAGPRTNEDLPPSGNGIAGILYKWVNYGQGWKRRWFVLQDGVLSYYQIHGPNKISLSVEIDRRSKLIGGESLRFICHHSKRGDVHSSGKPLGQIHLKVSSIGQSISDSKRFTVFTGTKSLHLRTVTSEDRKAWIEALQSVKETFPRMSNEELMATTTNVSISTDKLRQRLMKEDVWFPYATPKFSFITWLAVLNRLSTCDRTSHWTGSHSSECLLCNNAQESRNHLFFECVYSREIWRLLTSKLLGINYTASWPRLITLIQKTAHSCITTFLTRYVFQATVYNIWFERNRRQQGESSKTVTKLVTIIDKTVRNRLSSIRIMGDYSFEDAMTQWFAVRSS